MKEHPDYPWDHHSDQPYIIRNKELKRKIYQLSWFQMTKAILVTALVFPIVFLLQLLRKKTSLATSNPGRCIGLSVHVETEAKGKTTVSAEEIGQMLDDLGVRHVLMRIPLANIDQLEKYVSHLDLLKKSNREVIINLLQSRPLLDNPDDQQNALGKVLKALTGKVEYIQVGNAYNRKKWGFYHFREYNDFFQHVRTVSKQICPEIKLLGGSTIDFEPIHLIESLFHLRPTAYDGYATQLYVDRRGAPENKQLNLYNFLSKINFISLLHKLSFKSKGDLWITEFNWPLENTLPFAPCKDGLVSEQDQANFLARSYLIAIASGRVRTCYWHQLIAPGYGLVNNQTEQPRKHPSYYALATIIRLFSEASNVRYSTRHKGINGLYSFQCQTIYNGKPVTVIALWSVTEAHLNNPENTQTWLDLSGNSIENPASITESVVYAINN